VTFNAINKDIPYFINGNPGADVVSSAAGVSFSPASLSVPAKGQAAFQISFKKPARLDASLLPVYSGYIELGAGPAETLSIPYQGRISNIHQ
jgi:hypothetical protein